MININYLKFNIINITNSYKYLILLKSQFILLYFILF